MMLSIFSRFFGGDPPPRLVRREDLFRSAFDQAPVGIAFVGRDGHWLQFNERFLKLLGFPREDLLRTSLRELTHPEDRKVEAPHMRRLMAGEIPSYTLTKRLMQRNRRYGSFRVHVSSCSKGEGELEYFEYVISQAGEEAAAESLTVDVGSIYERVFDQLDDIAVIRSSTDGTIVAWSKGAEKILGYKAAEMVRKPRSILYRDADAFDKRPESDLQQALTHGRHDEEYWRVGKDGFTLWSHVTLIAHRPETGPSEVIEFVRQPSHVKNNPALDALKQRTEQLLSEARGRYEGLQRESGETIEKLAERIGELENEMQRRERAEATLRHALADLNHSAEETFRELKIMTDALKKEISRRKELEQLLSAARSELVEANDRWKVELESVLATHETPAEPAVEEPSPIDHQTLDADAFKQRVAEHSARGDTGVVVARRDDTEIRLYLEDGVLVACTSNLARSPIGEELVSSGVITDEQRDRALEIQEQTSIALGRVLLIIDAISREQLVRFMETRSRREAAELLEWSSVDYAFEPDTRVPKKLVPLRLDVMELWSTRHAEETPAAPIAAAEPAPVAAVAEPAEPAAPAAQATIHRLDPPSSHFIGNASKRSRKFHRPDCKLAAKIPEKSRVAIDGLEAAREGGFDPCSCVEGRGKRKRAARGQSRG